MKGDQQLVFPGMEKKYKLVFRDPSPVDLIVQAFESCRGRFTFDGDRMKAKRQAKLILKADHEKDDVIGCIEWLSDHPDHGLLNFGLAFVGRQMSQYMRVGKAVEAMSSVTLVTPPKGWGERQK